MIFRCHSEIGEKICLQFFPCKNLGADTSLDYVYKQNHLTVYWGDYQPLLLKFLKGVYPTTDPTDNEIVECFDECFMNWIGKEDWQRIIERIKGSINTKTPKNELEFYLNFTEWIETNLETNDLIMVEGNL